MEMKHSPIGGSSCPRFWSCPGSVELIKKAGDQVQTFYGAEGTAAHMIAENVLRALKRGEKVDINEYIGTTLMVFDFEIEITEEMINHIDTYVQTIEFDMFVNGLHYDHLLIEEKFRLNIAKDAFGTVDAILQSSSKAIIYDFKYGRGVVVNAVDNKQLLYYAVGATQGLNLKEVEIVIVQPRAYHEDGVVRRATYPINKIKAFGWLLETKIAATRKPDAPLVAGDWCHSTFCSAIHICPAVRKEVNEVAVRDFKDVSTLSNEVLISILKKEDRITAFLKQAKIYLQNQAEKGVEIPGFKLVAGRTNRTWVSEKEVIDAFDYLGEAVWEERKLKSPAQMEKLLAKKDRNAFLPFIAKKNGSITLVKDSDPREAVKSSAAKDFEDYDILEGE